jgi:hypothetical protein
MDHGGEMDISKVYFSEKMPKWCAALLTLTAVYAPYCWLWFQGEWNWSSIRIWPFLPGLAISALIPSLPGGPDFPFLFTCLLLGISLFAVLRVRKVLWPTAGGLFALSCASSWVIYLLMKA